MLKNILTPLSSLILFGACQVNSAKTVVRPDGIKPVIVTEETAHDTDDPAIWINKADTLKSLIIGTDKNSDGGLYAFDLEGKIVNKVLGLKRPNNVDIAYGFLLNGQPVDIAVVTERETNMIRVFRLPDLAALDNGGIPVFEGEEKKAPMGIALYTRKADTAIFAIVGRKDGPANGYIWQYRLVDEGGVVNGRLVRRFGAYSGKKEIESIAVDNQLGYVYYADETVGVRKYFADPAKQDDKELALFAREGFISDHEGISIYPVTDTTGYILVSNQQNNSFMVYSREGNNTNVNEHTFVAEVPLSTLESDGSDVTAVPLGAKFPGGLFVAMSNGKVFHYYSWDDIAGKIVKR